MGIISEVRTTIAARSLKGIISLAMIIVVITSVGCIDGSRSQENQISLDALFSGSDTDTLIDTNGDGIRALLVRADGSIAGLGAINLAEAVEIQPKDPQVSCTTSNGDAGDEYDLVQGHLALQVEGSMDIITGEFISNTQCFPQVLIAGPSIDFEGQWMVTGGTGRFVNSNGTIEFKGSARILLADPSGIFVIASAEHIGAIDIN